MKSKIYYLIVASFLILSARTVHERLVVYKNISTNQNIIKQVNISYKSNKCVKLVFIPFSVEKALLLEKKLSSDTLINGIQLSVSPDKLKKIGVNPPIFLTAIFTSNKDTIICFTKDSDDKKFIDTLAVVN